MVDRGGEPRTIERAGDRAARSRVVERRLAFVEFEIIDDVRGRAHDRQTGPPRRLDVEAREIRGIELPRARGEEPRLRVRLDQDVDPIDAGGTAPVVGIAFEDEPVAAIPAFEPERTEADRVRIERRRVEIGVVRRRMPRQDGERVARAQGKERRNERRVRRAQADDEPVAPRRLDARDRLDGRAIRHVRTRIAQRRDGEGDVARVEGRAVGPARPPQIVGDRPAVRRNSAVAASRHAQREIGHERTVLVDREEIALRQRCELPTVRRIEDRIQARRIVFDVNGERPRRGDRGLRRRERAPRETRGQQRRAPKREHAVAFREKARAALRL